MTEKTNSQILVPFQLEMVEGKITIGFVQSAQPFILDNKDKKQIKLMEDAIRKDNPLRVFTEPESTYIVKIEDVDDEERNSYKKNLVHKKDFLKPGTKKAAFIDVIPDEQTLNHLFQVIVAQTCQVPPAANCIPFNFVSDGCYARAHKMRQILNNAGYECQKYFIHGNLAAQRTPGTCCVQWVYHVAPLVTVMVADPMTQDYILDPSLFNHPVSIHEWKQKCTSGPCGGFKNITGENELPGFVYTYNPTADTGTFDNSYNMTNCVIQNYAGLSGCGYAPAIPQCWMV